MGFDIFIISIILIAIAFIIGRLVRSILKQGKTSYFDELPKDEQDGVIHLLKKM